MTITLHEEPDHRSRCQKHECDNARIFSTQDNGWDGSGPWYGVQIFKNGVHFDGGWILAANPRPPFLEEMAALRASNKP